MFGSFNSRTKLCLDKLFMFLGGREETRQVGERCLV